MSAAAPPSRRALPCQRDPERWFDRGNRVEALAGCLACPARQWCAREALSCTASWGMWAGVWIEDNHDAAVPYLRAIATNDAPQTDHQAQLPAVSATTAPPMPAPVVRPSEASPARSVSAALLARSSGHCEVMADGCRYSVDRTVSRRPGGAAYESCSPAEVFATCQRCADTVAGLAPRLAIQLGYVVLPGRDPAAVPFQWRGARWVFFRRDGWLTEVGADAESA